jgi:glycosyltransferase involved in cell wall biosynthesis
LPKVHIIRCGIGESFTQAATPVDPDSRRFLCIARFAPAKGHLLLLDAFARLVRSGAEAQLVLAGDGELRREIESHVAALGIPDRVEITGWIDETGVRRHIRECRVVVVSSFAEGLPGEGHKPSGRRGRSGRLCHRRCSAPPDYIPRFCPGWVGSSGLR